MHHKNLDERGIQNSLGEFLDAVLLDEYGTVRRETVSELILRVADSTIPDTVHGADNIVFEGRLPSWTAYIKSDWEGAISAKAVGKALREGLTELGRIVVGYDCAPGEQRRRSSSDCLIDMRSRDVTSIIVSLDSDGESSDEKGPDQDGLLVPKGDVVLNLYDV